MSDKNDLQHRISENIRRAGDLSVIVRMGHITEEERLILEHYRAADTGIRTVFVDLIRSLPRVFPR
jgi:hypothetical protein